MFDNQVTRNQFGQSNARDTELFSDMYIQDETKSHVYIEDWDYYNGPATATAAGGFTLSGTGATAAQVAGDGGILQLTAATSAFIATLQRTIADFSIAAGFRTWYRALLQLSSLANSGQIIAGLTNVTATPFTAITDGVWFSTTVATGAISLNVAVGSVVTTVALGSNLVAAALADLKWYWDGGIYAAAPNGRIVGEVSGPGVSVAARVEIPAPVNFPGVTLLAHQTGLKATAGAPTLGIDLIMGVKDRVNYLATPTF